MSRLKHIREQLNLTQEEVADKSGVSVRTIQRIESGTLPKGHTLKALSNALEVPPSELLASSEKPTETQAEKAILYLAKEDKIDFRKIKLINLSSVFFVVLPPLNILAPLLLFYALKQNNHITKQIISLQLLWTILAPVVFMLGILLKLGRSFTIVLLVAIVLSNILLILRNLAEIDRNKRLRYKLNFNII